MKLFDGHNFIKFFVNAIIGLLLSHNPISFR